MGKEEHWPKARAKHKSKALIKKKASSRRNKQRWVKIKQEKKPWRLNPEDTWLQLLLIVGYFCTAFVLMGLSDSLLNPFMALLKFYFLAVAISYVFTRIKLFRIVRDSYFAFVFSLVGLGSYLFLLVLGLALLFPTGMEQKEEAITGVVYKYGGCVVSTNNPEMNGILEDFYFQYGSRSHPPELLFYTQKETFLGLTFAQRLSVGIEE